MSYRVSDLRRQKMFVGKNLHCIKLNGYISHRHHERYKCLITGLIKNEDILKSLSATS